MVEWNLCWGKTEETPRKTYPYSDSTTKKTTWSDRDVNSGPQRSGGRQATNFLSHKRGNTVDKFKIAEHSWEQKHRFQWDKASIISKEENSRIRKVKESELIHCTDHVLSQPSTDVSLIWLPIMRPEIKRKQTVTWNINRVKIDNNPQTPSGLVVSVPDY